MPLSRRALLATASAALMAPRLARATAVTDDAGRSIIIPDNVHHVFPAGLPAAILLYTLAPERLIGWPHANRAEECVYFQPRTCDKPVLGTLTGRAGNFDLGSLAAHKPDLILDVGSTGPRFVALAASVQKQRGLPS